MRTEPDCQTSRSLRISQKRAVVIIAECRSVKYRRRGQIRLAKLAILDLSERYRWQCGLWLSTLLWRFDSDQQGTTTDSSYEHLRVEILSPFQWLSLHTVGLLDPDIGLAEALEDAAGDAGVSTPEDSASTLFA